MTIMDIVSLQGGARHDDLTTLQIAAGFLSWMNILKVFSLILGAVCFAFLFGRAILRMLTVFANVPFQVYEVLAYPLSLALIAAAVFVSPEHAVWMIVPGCVLFTGMVLLSAQVREVKPNPPRFFALLTVLYGAVALYFQSDIVGFAAVAALMGLAGFSILVGPLCYCIGFRDDKSLGRATAAGLLLTILLVADRLLSPHVAALEVFRTGMLWLGPFVFSLGMLITSTRWGFGEERNYLVKQIVTVIAYIVLMALGSMLGLDALRNVGTGFLVLYIIEKPFEIPFRSATGFAAVGLVMSVIVGYGVFWTQDHPDKVQAMFPHRITLSVE